MSWNTFVENTTETATCVVGAAGGVASSQLSDFIIAKTGLTTLTGSNTFGGLGMSFLVRAATNAALLQVMAMVRPDQNRSMLYDIVYYAGDQKLITSAVALARYAVNGVVAIIPRNWAPPAAGAKTAPASDCACKH